MIPFVRTEQQVIDASNYEEFEEQDMRALGVPEDAVGIWVYGECYSSNYPAFYYIRCNGSSDEWGVRVRLNVSQQTMVYVALDANGIVETRHVRFYSGGVYYTPYGDIYLMGYLLSPVVMFTNGVDKSETSPGDYVDCACSDICPGAKLIIANSAGGSTASKHFIRMNGSADDRYAVTKSQGIDNGKLIGVDASVVFEQKIENVNANLFIYGYCPSYVTMHTNAIDRSLSATGAWTDITPTEGAGVAFMQFIQGASSANSGGLRTNGEAEAPYEQSPAYCSWDWMVEVDESGLIEGKISAVAIDFYELGYGRYNAPPLAPTDLYCEGEAEPAAVEDDAPELSAVLNDDTVGETLTHVAVQVGSSEGVADLWDSGWVDIADVGDGERCEDVSYAGTELPVAGQTLYWRIRAKDIDGGEGTWSAWTTFTMTPMQISVDDSGVGEEQNMTVGDEFIMVADTGVAEEAMSDALFTRTRGIIVIVPAKDPAKDYPEKDTTIEYDPN